jgi:hypothetical protein
MGLKDDLRKIRQITRRERAEEELTQSFLGHLDYILGRADEDHPASERFVDEGVFWRVERDGDPKDARDLSK